MAEAERKQSESEKLWQDLWDAHREWGIALQQFNDAVDPEIIDDAIYMLMAAEMRYEGLLRIARRRRLSVDPSGRVTDADQLTVHSERYRAVVPQEASRDTPLQ